MNCIKIIRVIVLFFLFSSCSSVKKYNEQISKKHAPDELRQDVDYAYKKLKKLHPELYLYISKEKLENKFESLKNGLTKPLSGIEFNNLLNPIIISIRQGHTSIKPPHLKQTKEDKKEKGKRENPFKTINFANVQNKVFIKNTYGKDSSIIAGSELLAVDSKNVEDLIASFDGLHTGDGYNKTFMPYVKRKWFGAFYYKTHKLKDSINLQLKFKDSLYSKYIYSYNNKKEKNAIKTDSIKSIKKVKLSKTERKIEKRKRKEKYKWENKYAYNKFQKLKYRDLSFIDSTKSIAMIKVRGFVGKNYKTFYKETFKKIDSVKSENLIIDLRDNGGGSLREINEFYSYLAQKEYYFINKSKMTKGSSWLYPSYHSKSILIKSLFTIFYPLTKVAQIIKVKNINGKPHFKFASSKLQKPKTTYNYKGKIYVLINGLSFSASSVISSNLKNNNRAFFVGDETGGSQNSTVAGRFVSFELPNSKLKLSFGLMNIDMPNKILPDGYGVKPDKYIKTTTLDKDEQLEWVLNDIKSKN